MEDMSTSAGLLASSWLPFAMSSLRDYGMIVSSRHRAFQSASSDAFKG